MRGLDILLVLAACTNAALASTIPMVSCAEAVTCEYQLKTDPENNSDPLRCRSKNGFSDSCKESYCCQPMPSSVSCNSIWAKVNCGSAGFQKGPPKCDPTKKSSSKGCKAAVCCNGRSSMLTCDKAIKCQWGYNPDKEVAGVRQCVNVEDESDSCTTKYCCSPAPAVVSCSEMVDLCQYYARDPKTGSVKRCKPESKGKEACNKAYCCGTEDDVFDRRSFLGQSSVAN